MEILTAILIVIFFLGGIITIIASTEKNIDFGVSSIVLFIIGLFFICTVIMLAILASKAFEKERSLNKYDLKTEIRQELLNGQEVSRDTVYIFTPKN